MPPFGSVGDLVTAARRGIDRSYLNMCVRELGLGPLPAKAEKYRESR